MIFVSVSSFSIRFFDKSNAFSRELLAEHIRTCVARDVREGREETLDELVATIQKLMK